MSEQRRSNPIDLAVGQRMKQRRRQLSWSQEELAEKLGLSFQQVQKYERGANRVSAGRLFHLCEVLDVDVSYFFDGLTRAAAAREEGDPEALSLARLVAPAGALDVLTAYGELASPRRRKMVIAFARMLVEEEAAEATDRPAGGRSEGEPS